MNSALFTKLRDGDIIPSVIPTSQATSIKGGLVLHYATATGGEGEKIERAATLTQPDVEFAAAVRPLSSSHGEGANSEVGPLTFPSFNRTPLRPTLSS